MKVRVKLIKSPIGCKPKQRKTVKALGLKKLNGTVEKDATSSILGMVNSIRHMVEVEEID